MTVDLDVRFWYDKEFSPTDLLRQMIEVIELWPPVTGAWQFFVIENARVRDSHCSAERALPLEELKRRVEDYRDNDALEFSVDIEFRCWDNFDEPAAQKTTLALSAQAWGKGYARRFPQLNDAPDEGLAALRIIPSAIYHAWLDYAPADAGAAALRNQRVEENLAELTALLCRSIEALQPTTVKVFEDIAEYTAPHANLVYYRDLAEIVKEVRFLHARDPRLRELAQRVTEETAALVLEAGDWPARRVATGWLVPSRPHFLNGRLQEFYATLLDLVRDPVRKQSPVEVPRRVKAVREQAVKSLGQLRDARATESLVTALEDVEGEVRAEGLQDAIQYLAQYRDPRVIPALIAQMRGYDSMGAAKHALLDLKAHVGREERAMIIAAIAADEREEQGKAQALYAARDSDAARDSEAPFTLETYRAFIEETRLLRIKYEGATSSRNFSLAQEAARRLVIELPLVYRARLPMYLLARCPLCGEQVRESVDTFSLSGTGWWISEPDGFGWFGRRLQRGGHETLHPLAAARYTEPSYTAACEHVQAVHYGVNLNGIIPDDLEQARYVVIGSERPGVLRPFMEQAGSYAVIHALPVGRLDDVTWQPHYTAYFVTYFSQDAGAFQRSLLPLKWYERQFLWPYEWMDYDLSPWVAAGKLSWLGEASAGFPLCQRPEDFPYGQLPGLTGRWAANTVRGAELLPPFQGVALYLPRRLPAPLAAEEDAALQARGFQSIRKAQAERAVQWARQSGRAANLERCQLFDANLAGIDLAGACIREGSFIRADMRDANLQGVEGTKACFNHALLVAADLSGARLDESWAERADLQGANLARASLKQAYWRQANLKGANLTGANLEGANLQGANLAGADLTGAILTNTQLAKAAYDDRTRWPEGFDPHQRDSRLNG